MNVRHALDCVLDAVELCGSIIGMRYCFPFAVQRQSEKSSLAVSMLRRVHVRAVEEPNRRQLPNQILKLIGRDFRSLLDVPVSRGALLKGDSAGGVNLEQVCRT